MSLRDRDACLSIVGKTVSGVFRVREDEILFVFTDGTHSVIEAGGDYGDPVIYEGSIVLWDYRKHLDLLLSLGAITQDEFDECRELERLDKCREIEQANRRAEYERLKKEFGQ